MGKKGLVHWIGIPFIYNLDSMPLGRVITTTLSHPIGDVSLSVDVKITVAFSSREFDYQELFDVVIKSGFDHIDDWVSNLFYTTALKDSAVIEAFENYVKHERPVLFMEQLGDALKNLQFSGHPLSNIKQIKVNVELNTVKALLQAIYNGV